MRRFSYLSMVVLAALGAALVLFTPPAWAGYSVRVAGDSRIRALLEESPEGTYRVLLMVEPDLGPRDLGRGVLEISEIRGGWATVKWPKPPYTHSLAIRPGEVYFVRARIFGGKKSWTYSTTEVSLVEREEPAGFPPPLVPPFSPPFSPPPPPPPPPAFELPPAPEPMALVVVSVRDETGCPAFGRVCLHTAVGDLEAEGIGTIEAHVPQGPVTLGVRQDLGLRWAGADQPMTQVASAVAPVVWDLQYPGDFAADLVARANAASRRELSAVEVVWLNRHYGCPRQDETLRMASELASYGVIHAVGGPAWDGRSIALAYQLWTLSGQRNIELLRSLLMTWPKTLVWLGPAPQRPPPSPAVQLPPPPRPQPRAAVYVLRQEDGPHARAVLVYNPPIGPALLGAAASIVGEYLGRTQIRQNLSASATGGTGGSATATQSQAQSQSQAQQQGQAQAQSNGPDCP